MEVNVILGCRSGNFSSCVTFDNNNFVKLNYSVFKTKQSTKLTHRIRLH